MTVTAGLLAHQGGWDEILLILTPIALFAGLLWLANRRADAGLRDRAAGSDGEGDDEGPPATSAGAPADEGGAWATLDDRGPPSSPPPPE